MSETISDNVMSDAVVNDVVYGDSSPMVVDDVNSVEMVFNGINASLSTSPSPFTEELLLLAANASPFHTTTRNSGGTRNNEVRMATLIVYLVTFVFGIIGNTLVIYVIAKYDRIRSRSVSNYYIWNLAFADELFVLTIPFFCFASYTNDWIFGDWMCKIVTVFRECNKFASVFTLMALSIDRFLATFHNLGRFREIKVGVGVCVVIWILCVILSIPYWILSKAKTMQHRVSCGVQWPNDNQVFYRQIAMYFNLIVGMAAPFAVIVTFNVILLVRIRQRTRNAGGATVQRMRLSGDNGAEGSGAVTPMDRSSKSRLVRNDDSPAVGGAKTAVRNRASSSISGRGQMMNQINSSMTRMVMVIVVLFAVCQLPCHIVEYFNIRVMIVKSLPSPTVMEVFFYGNMIATMLVFVSSCYNPIIYGIFNKNYQNVSADEANVTASRRLTEDRETTLKQPARLPFDGSKTTHCSSIMRCDPRCFNVLKNINERNEKEDNVLMK